MIWTIKEESQGQVGGREAAHQGEEIRGFRNYVLIILSFRANQWLARQD